MRRLHAVLFLILMLGSSLPIQIFAAPAAAGRVIISLGSVSDIGSSGAARLLKRGDSVFSGDTIKTGTGAKAQLRFTDNTLIALSEVTEFKIKDYALSPQTAGKIDQYMLAKNDSATSGQAIAAVQNSNDLKIAPTLEARDKMLVSLAKGGLRMVTGAIGKSNPSAYELGTVVGTIGVRGTGLNVISSKKETQIYVYHGRAYLKLLGMPTAINLGPDSGYTLVTISGNTNNPVVTLQPNPSSPPQPVNTSTNTVSGSSSNNTSSSENTSGSSNFSSGGSASNLPSNSGTAMSGSGCVLVKDCPDCPPHCQ